MNWKEAVTWCIMLLQKACISNALRVLAVNAVSCCKSCKGYEQGYRSYVVNLCSLDVYLQKQRALFFQSNA